MKKIFVLLCISFLWLTSFGQGFYESTINPVYKDSSVYVEYAGEIQAYTFNGDEINPIYSSCKLYYQEIGNRTIFYIKSNFTNSFIKVDKNPFYGKQLKKGYFEFRFQDGLGDWFYFNI